MICALVRPPYDGQALTDKRWRDCKQAKANADFWQDAYLPYATKKKRKFNEGLRRKIATVRVTEGVPPLSGVGFILHAQKNNAKIFALFFIVKVILLILKDNLLFR